MEKHRFTEWELIHNKCYACGGTLTSKPILSDNYLVVCDGCDRSMLIKKLTGDDYLDW